MGTDYSIADISLLGWVRNLIGFYGAREIVGFDRFLHVQAWLDRGLARPAVRRRARSDGGLEASGCWPMSSRAANRSVDARGHTNPHPWRRASGMETITTGHF